MPNVQSNEPRKYKSLWDTLTIEQKSEFLDLIAERAVAMCKPILDELGVDPVKLKNYKWTPNELIGFACGQIRYEKEKRRAVILELKKATRKVYSGSQSHIDFIAKVLEEV